ncbi:MAG: bifunctional diaminohydroxyphosphoribosylaminopyrimidine deaminase/5-amino-6-(5-phosphoribosylamino)uracil reductase RibD [Culturomica sp.]|jgi:diaminohydroxyphosphoribosylaminopyrimidine deaminase/5-amino-6-(5-phosphoribosylamino)uracil reductase|nr:bifunctional diaminohydroxyphosphoribosylaminopyrimidine deaminase/5-amino-6-(5-phosphoribosylamino)uracil reductase RibD [Culturomica sp.]
MEEDVKYMRRAMELAENGKGWVNPNPLVGAVIVKDGRIIGEGWHERYGGLHAERNALKNATEPVEGSVMYVTLEPCCHHGHTPPCTEAIIEAGISKVVIGLTDPNPKVSGKGILILKEAGIEVVLGVCEDELIRQNRVFLKYITTRLPWITMKSAMTLDGKIAAFTGDSKWVSGEESRMMVQRMRAENMGIMVGANTVKCDNPMLTCRLDGDVRQPIRIIVDSKAGMPLDTKVLQTANEYRTVIACTNRYSFERFRDIRKSGAEILVCSKSRNAHVNLKDMLQRLGKMGIDSILLEGGGSLNYSFLSSGLIDEVFMFIAPKFIGGSEALTPIEGLGIEEMSKAVPLKDVQVTTVGDDILINGRINVYRNYRKDWKGEECCEGSEQREVGD